MKKFLIAAAASLIIFGGQTEAAPVDDLNAKPEMQDIKTHGKWANFRDKYILGRETENERRDRKDWERRHGYRSSNRKERYYPPPPPPPPYYRDDGRRYYPPPPPPPPPSRRDGYYPPPPTRYR